MNFNIRRSLTAVFGLITTTFGALALPSPSYAGTPKCAASRQTPATSTFIRQMAKSKGIINDNMSTITQNRRVGRSFQEFVMRSMRYDKENGMLFDAPARRAAGSRPRVRPDFTERVIYVTDTMGRKDPYGNFIEVKATGSLLTPNYSSYQILGHIDAVSIRPAASYTPGAARVTFITTSDTLVSPSTLAEANSRKVSIWQSIVCSTSSGQLQVGPATVLNPGVYGSNQIAIDGQPGVLNELSLPGTAPAGYEDAYGGY